MKKGFLTVSAYISLIILTTGCSKDNPLNPLGDCGNVVWTEQVQAELTAWSNAISTYSGNPTTENCEAYKVTGKAYLDALEDVKACVGAVNLQAYNQAISEAKKDLNETDCSNL